MKLIIQFLLILGLTCVCLAQNVVRYDLTIDETTVNYLGKTVKALVINGSIPAPTLTFTEGDIAEIHVLNKLNEESSLHWHGILLPNEQDGVANLTTTPIKPKGTHVFRFAIRQSCTYWYHSHSNLQEQCGLFGKNQFFSAYVGFDFNREKHHAAGMWENEIHATGGVECILPMFV